MIDLVSLCDDGEMLDGLVRSFEQRVAKGAKFHTVLHHLRSAKESLDQRMNLAADVMERVATETAVPFDISPAEQPTADDQAAG